MLPYCNTLYCTTYNTLLLFSISSGVTDPLDVEEMDLLLGGAMRHLLDEVSSSPVNPLNHVNPVNAMAGASAVHQVPYMSLGDLSFSARVLEWISPTRGDAVEEAAKEAAGDQTERPQRREPWGGREGTEGAMEGVTGGAGGAGWVRFVLCRFGGWKWAHALAAEVQAQVRADAKGGEEGGKGSKGGDSAQKARLRLALSQVRIEGVDRWIVEKGRCVVMLLQIQEKGQGGSVARVALATMRSHTHTHTLTRTHPQPTHACSPLLALYHPTDGSKLRSLVGRTTGGHTNKGGGRGGCGCG